MVVPLVAAAGINAAAGLAEAGLSGLSTSSANKESWKHTKKLAQNQVQWRVADAVKAGLHPLAALGMNPASGPTVLAPDLSGIGDMGANIGQLVQAYSGDSSSPQATVLADLAVKRAQLENDLLTSQIQNSNRVLLNQGRAGSADVSSGAMGVPQADGSVINITQKPGAQGEVFEKDMSDLGVVFAFNRFMQNFNEYMGQIPVYSGGPALKKWWNSLPGYSGAGKTVIGVPEGYRGRR